MKEYDTLNFYNENAQTYVGDEPVIKEGKYYNLLRKNELEHLLSKADIPAVIYDHSETLLTSKRPGTEMWGNFYIRRTK